LVGPSGCGKSTLFNGILGTHPPTSGRVIVGRNGQEHVVTGPNRNCGIVYQHYALYPFLTVLEGVAFGLMLDETSLPFRAFRPLAWRKLRSEHLDRAAAALRRVHLSDADFGKYASELSGGMQQRVAVAQAIVMRPQILLLDEPFGALDEATRESLQTMLLEFYEENRQAIARGEPPPHTMIIVTHELTEAIYVADRVLGLSQYWDWRAEGHAACPGATIVYDKPAPVYRPGEPKNYEQFAVQRRDIRETVFEPPTPTPRGKHVTFWDDARAGRVQGVIAP
ncbi:ATP-binding cassette domain-containing protein, partial [Candidatus Uhrbacteria bacterium]|nr:ATP-binding cassette domain-containing protein [Candidatus Uhrbacteria bacterium]